MSKASHSLAAACVLAFSTSLPAMAAVPDWYSDESAGESVSYLGLEWLSWDQTLNMSINQALDSYSADGWRLATNLEVTTLFNSLFTSDAELQYEAYNYDTASSTYEPRPFDTYENSRQSTWSAETHENSSFFTGQFGITDHFCDPSDFWGCQTYTAALYGSDSDGDGLYNLASFSYTAFEDMSDSLAELSTDSYDANHVSESLEASLFDSYSTGVALVRAPRPSTHYHTHAPEINGQGAALALALLASLMMFFRERFNLRTTAKFSV